jgi:hypothetical protein
MPLQDNNHRTSPPHRHTAPSATRTPPELGPPQTFYEDHLRFLLTVALPDVSTGQHGSELEDLTISDSAGSTARLDRTDNGDFLVTENGLALSGTKWNTFTSSGKRGVDPTANATDSPPTVKARPSGSTNHTTRRPGTCPARSHSVTGTNRPNRMSRPLWR